MNSGTNGGTPDTHCGSLYEWIMGSNGYTLYPGIHQYPNANYKDFTSVTLTYWYKIIYEKIMEEVCLHHNIPCAKVVLANRSSLTYDWTHPNVACMTEMADQIWNQLKSHLQ